jgi:hypothetical protein
MTRKIVIKRKTTDKQASPQKRREFLSLKADFLSKTIKGGGILNNYLPRNVEEGACLTELKKNYYAEFITPRKTRSNDNEIMRNYFQKTAFIKALLNWVILYIDDSAKQNIKKISAELASTQQNIYNSQIKTEKEQDLETILEIYAPQLIYSPRKSRWWEDQFSKGKLKLRLKLLNNNIIL